MNKQDSLKFLQNCIDRITNASEEDIEIFRMKYDKHCTESRKEICTDIVKGGGVDGESSFDYGYARIMQ